MFNKYRTVTYSKNFKICFSTTRIRFQNNKLRSVLNLQIYKRLLHAWRSDAPNGQRKLLQCGGG